MSELLKIYIHPRRGSSIIAFILNYTRIKSVEYNFSRKFITKFNKYKMATEVDLYTYNKPDVNHSHKFCLFTDGGQTTIIVRIQDS